MSSRIALLCPVASAQSARLAALPAEHARKIGADALWLQANGDTHSALLHTAAAIAAHAQDLDLIVSGVVLPVRQLLREAEDIASLDGLCAGRLEVALAWTPGLDADRAAEEIHVLRDAWGARPVDHAGAHHTFSGIDVHPKPERPGGPPLWIDAREAACADSERERIVFGAFGFAASHGCGWVSEFPSVGATPSEEAAASASGASGSCSGLALFAGSFPTGAEPMRAARERLERVLPPSTKAAGGHDVVGIFCDPALSV